jgi:hypothetical protein
MSKFPLYDRLSSNTPSRDLTMAQKMSFVKKIKKIDQNGYELMYALMRMYQLENEEENSSFIVPYNGVFQNNDIIFDINELPKKLRQILLKFLTVHIRKMKEEDIIKNSPVKRLENQSPNKL